MNTATTVMELYGAEELSILMSDRPKDAQIIAISKNKCTSIFYKNVSGEYFADYRNGNGWEKTRQRSRKELNDDLRCISLIPVEIDELVASIERMAGVELKTEDKILHIKSRVNAQMLRVDLRREHDDLAYWQGQHDAYETVQHIIRGVEGEKHGL
jgi:hypothetical protein